MGQVLGLKRMFIENKFSTTRVPKELLQPDEHDPEFVRDYDRGGKAPRNTDLGVNLNHWVFFIEENQVYCKIQGTEEKFLIVEGTSITEVTGTFDRNMNPFVVYRDQNAYIFYWYDALTNKYVSEELPADTSSPRLCHDDKRKEAAVYSDVIVTYIRGSELLYRLQRDRFTIVYIAANRGVRNREIIRFGMNKSLRLQWTLDQANKYRDL